MEHKAEIEIITPVHIGSGEPPIGKMEYFQQENKFYIMDMVKLVEEYSKFYNEDIEKVVEKFINIFSNLNNNKIEDKYHDEIYNNEFKEYLLKNKKYEYSVDIGISAKTNKNIAIQRTIKTIDNTFIPGSSIKGAIRTAILTNFLSNTKDILELYNSSVEEGRISIKKMNSNIENYVKKKVNVKKGDNWFRHIQVSDFLPNEKDNIIIENVYGKVGRGNSLRAEFLKPSSIFNGTIKVPFSLSKLIEINNNYVMRYLIFAINKLPNNSKNKYLLLKKELRAINDLEEPKTMYMLLGSYNGWFSKTVNTIYGTNDEIHSKFKRIVRIIYRNTNPNNFPNSFGTINGNIIGLVKVEFK